MLNFRFILEQVHTTGYGSNDVFSKVLEKGLSDAIFAEKEYTPARLRDRFHILIELLEKERKKERKAARSNAHLSGTV